MNTSKQSSWQSRGDALFELHREVAENMDDSAEMDLTDASRSPSLSMTRRCAERVVGSWTTASGLRQPAQRSRAAPGWADER